MIKKDIPPGDPLPPVTHEIRIQPPQVIRTETIIRREPRKLTPREREAFLLVTRCADQYANGHEHCKKIMEAVTIVRGFIGGAK